MMVGSRKLRGDHCRCSTFDAGGGCGEYFNSTAAFDKHRTGRHGIDRRCMSVPEMLQAGMALSSTGWWLTERRIMAAVTRGRSAGAAIGTDPSPGHAQPPEAA
ncbi:MAG TPA: hypothetical protein VES65_11345 [Solirubrobacteraceae bacterium]|nr:hypothetical protein [Solirubrobacteraceae bacterium]